MLWLRLESDISFPAIKLQAQLQGNCPSLVVVINQLRFPYGIPRMPHCPLFGRLVYEGCFIICASVRARDVLPPLSIKVQVVTMVWHSLSACGFCGPCTRAAGEHWLSQSASRRGERWEGRRWVLSPPVCVVKPP